jgi:hypothetical protein
MGDETDSNGVSVHYILAVLAEDDEPVSVKDLRSEQARARDLKPKLAVSASVPPVRSLPAPPTDPDGRGQRPTTPTAEPTPIAVPVAPQAASKTQPSARTPSASEGPWDDKTTPTARRRKPR